MIKSLENFTYPRKRVCAFLAVCRTHIILSGIMSFILSYLENEYDLRRSVWVSSGQKVAL